MAGLLGSTSPPSAPTFSSPRFRSALLPAPFVASVPVRTPRNGVFGGFSSRAKGGRRGLRVCNVAAAPPPATEAMRQAAKESQRPVYPFCAIVGQDEMKLCLLLNVIDPKIGGVMIMGDRGTGKSTTVRSLVDLLPEINVVSGDPFNSDPEDPESMGVEVRERISNGDSLEIVTTKINMC